MEIAKPTKKQIKDKELADEFKLILDGRMFSTNGTTKMDDIIDFVIRLIILTPRFNKKYLINNYQQLIYYAKSRGTYLPASIEEEED
jgi:hypothetical protein